MLFYQWFALFSGVFCYPAQESACASMTFPDYKVGAIQSFDWNPNRGLAIVRIWNRMATALRGDKLVSVSVYL